MSFSLTQPARTLLLFLSAGAYAAWFSGFGERTDAQDIGTSNARGLPLSYASAPVAFTIVRDPFAGGAASSSPPLPAAEDTPVGVPSVSVPDISVAGAGEAASAAIPPTDRVIVRATIVGPNSVAYVEVGSRMEIVRVGDVLNDERVAKIDLRGVSFLNGTRLDLPEGYLATPPPVQSVANALAVGLSNLRRLFAAHLTAVAPGRALTKPSTAPSANAPTPAPLRTVDTRGLAVGTTPTADPGGATPFPYPYPYPPPR